MSDRTETDNALPRAAERIAVLKQVLPLPHDFVLAAGAELPVWIVDREIHIGRETDPERDICLKDDGKASKRHARLRPIGKSIEIADAGSKNHTFVNGRQVTTATLHDGDVVRTGNTLFVLRLERSELGDAPRTDRDLHERLLGSSQEMRALRHALSQAARSSDNVLLTGQTGTGKELGANAVHALSARRSRPFVAINCASIQPGTAESMLFGHKRGAFTGAERDHEGAFKRADTGTLFLDELGELPLDIQPKLLRALQPATPGQPPPAGQNLVRIQIYGGSSEETINVRVLAGTNVDLERAVEAGRFRRDLFQRLCVRVVRFPALSARREDILPILHHYLNQDRPVQRPRRVSARLSELLLLRRWPGNVRELVNVSTQLLQHALATSDDVSDLERLPAELVDVLTAAPPPDATDPPGDAALQRVPITPELLTRLLAENKGLISRVARVLQRSPKQIRRRMDEFGIHRPMARRKTEPAKNSAPSGEKDDDDDSDDDGDGDGEGR